MTDIKVMPSTKVASLGAEKTDGGDIDTQLKGVLDLIGDGKTSAAMIKCAKLNKMYKSNKWALQKIADFMDKFRLPSSRTILYSIQGAGDNAKHHEIIQELAYHQPIGMGNKLQISLKCFNRDIILGTIGFARHSGSFLDKVEYSISGEASIKEGAIQNPPLSSLPLFNVAGAIRYYLAYSRGYFGYNRDVGFYGDGQVGLTYNGYNLGGGYAQFPYFNTSSNQVKSSKGGYGEIGKYFQFGEKVNLYGVAKIPIGTLKPGQLPLYVALSLNVKIAGWLEMMIQGSYFFIRGYKEEWYMQGMGSLGFGFSF